MDEWNYGVMKYGKERIGNGRMEYLEKKFSFLNPLFQYSIISFSLLGTQH